MQFYSGGLGILAGDHCKSASDAALPFIGIGLLYRRGYFRQQIDADGHQEHAQPDLDPDQLPMRRARGRDGAPLQVSVEIADRSVHAAVWVAQVGRVPILLLDTDIPANDEADRPITHILYVRGREMRLCQELVLGIGGVRALRALGIEPAVWHLNEGHSAFLLVERAGELVAADPSLAAGEALRRVGRNAVFTIHTPVPAGNEVFARDLVTGALDGWFRAVSMEPRELLELGRGHTDEPDAPFDMTAFVLRHAIGANAVSKLHAATATETWQELAGHPIDAITNGVHVPTWLGRPVRRLVQRAIGVPLGVDLNGPEPLGHAWSPSKATTCGARTSSRSASWSASSRDAWRASSPATASRPRCCASVRGLLDPEALTIGFARRFATYKRAALLFSDEGRLARILSSEDRPVQIVIAGKAHPADRPGQQVIQDIFTLSRSERLRGRVFIVEDYDMRVARFLVGGVDIWLNNPRRPLEASGTSGMKAAINGIPSVSILDGWWDEGFTGDNGWAIGDREPDGDDARPGRRRRRRAVSAARGGDRAALLRPRCRRSAAGVAGDHARVDRLRPVAVQHGAHALRVRRPALPPGGAGARARLGQVGPRVLPHAVVVHREVDVAAGRLAGRALVADDRVVRDDRAGRDDDVRLHVPVPGLDRRPVVDDDAEARVERPERLAAGHHHARRRPSRSACRSRRRSRSRRGSAGSRCRRTCTAAPGRSRSVPTPG